MKDSMKPGLEHVHTFVVPDSKVVARLYPESGPFQDFPEVFATGFMIGLMEWACVEAMAPHLDEGEGSLGVHVDISHEAATPPGLTVTVRLRLEKVDGRRLTFHVEADDGVDIIGRGRHERFVVDWDRFRAKLEDKAEKARRETARLSE